MKDNHIILAGWLIDGTGEPVRRNRLVHIEDGVITAINKKDPEEKIEKGARFTDLSHCTVLPGLVDCHVHLAMSGTNDMDTRRRQLNFAFEEAKPVISENLREHLRHGVTAVRDGGDCAAHTLRFKAESFPAPEYPPRLNAAGKAWRAGGRYGRMIGRPPEEGFTLAQCIERLERATDHVKILNSGMNSLKEFGKETPPQFSAGEMEAAVSAARKYGLHVMAHANGKLPVRICVDAGCRSIEHGFFMGRENLDRMAELQTFWVPTAFSMKAYARELDPGCIEADVSLRNLDHQLEQIAYAGQAGVPVALGTDSGGLGLNHGAAVAEEMKLLLEAGFTIEEAIRSATLEGARLLGIEREYGRIEAGMPATFIAAEGDPSGLPDSLTALEMVCIRGRET